MIKCKMLVTKIQRQQDLLKARKGFEKLKEDNNITAKENKVVARKNIIKLNKGIELIENFLRKNKKYDFDSPNFMFQKEDVEKLGGIEQEYEQKRKALEERYDKMEENLENKYEGKERGKAKVRRNRQAAKFQEELQNMAKVSHEESNFSAKEDIDEQEETNLPSEEDIIRQTEENEKNLDKEQNGEQGNIDHEESLKPDTVIISDEEEIDI